MVGASEGRIAKQLRVGKRSDGWCLRRQHCKATACTSREAHGACLLVQFTRGHRREQVRHSEICRRVRAE